MSIYIELFLNHICDLTLSIAIIIDHTECSAAFWDQRIVAEEMEMKKENDLSRKTFCLKWLLD
jgi:hypothetical protein